jgi:hypothetical protein
MHGTQKQAPIEFARGFNILTKLLESIFGDFEHNNY